MNDGFVELSALGVAMLPDANPVRLGSKDCKTGPLGAASKRAERGLTGATQAVVAWV